MLQAIRDKMTGRVAWVVIAILVIPFVFVGVSEFASGPGPATVAEVNGHPIDRDQFELVYRRASERQPASSSVEQISKLKNLVLDQLVDLEVAVQAAKKEGYYVGANYVSQKILAIDGFKVDGVFDPQQYLKVLGANGFNQKDFETEIERDLLRDQQRAAVEDSEFFTPAELELINKNQTRKIQFSYFIIPALATRKTIQQTDADLEKYYQAHIKNYGTVAKVKLAYVELKWADVAKTVEVSGVQLKQAYDSTKDQYRTAPIIKAAQILVSLNKNATAAQQNAAQIRVQKIQAELTAGADFAALVKKHSDDKFSPGGDIGIIDAEKNKVFFDALQTKKVGEYAAPVQDDQGWHILKVTLNKPGEIKTFEQVKTELASQLRDRQTRERYQKFYKEMKTETEENDESLDGAVSKLKLTVHESDWMSQHQKGVGLGVYDKVRELAFSADVFAKGVSSKSRNSAVIELDANTPKARAVVIRLKQHEAARVKTFTEVKEEVGRLWMLERIKEKSGKQAKELVVKITDNKSFAAMAKDAGFAVVQSGKVDRHQAKIPRELVEAAFSAGVPNKQKLPVAELSFANGDHAVFQIVGSEPGATDKQNPQLTQFLLQMQTGLFSREIYATVGKLLREQAKVAIYLNAITEDKPTDP